MNQLDKVAPHAQELERMADDLDAAGIGGHPTRGHAAILRTMACDLRAGAALGKTPAAFDLYASGSGGKLSLDHVNSVLTAAGVPASKRIEIKTALAREGLIG
jgi:hypothetical protein